MSLNISIAAYKHGYLASEFYTIQTPTHATTAILGSQSPLAAYKEWVADFHPKHVSQHLECLLEWQKECRELGCEIKVKMK